jgi:hypothetical protein
MGERRVDTVFWCGKLRERNHLEVPHVGGGIILRWIFKKWDLGLWTGFSWLRNWTVGGLS